ncbi:hypothetical protein FNV43_RR22777 [Rhamnella rubrinervis]|uniref:Kinesin motor domain-containing protein n=1 Tax=Rhamnella rubrinervis TaxID=2594499 RepID=A0A8K0GSC8_9ROSA|nr:hypothetical protein FNV43_RR22777 [Rhamnella rubrinervis]
MLRDFKFLRRNSGKSDEVENVPVNSKDMSGIRISTDSSRAPLNAIQESTQNPKPEQEVGVRSKADRTPSKAKAKVADPPLPLRTPDKHGAGFSARGRFGWAHKNEPGSTTSDLRDDVSSYSTQVNRAAGIGNGGFTNMTPRTARTVGRATSSYSESNSTQSTPTKSVSKPPNTGLRSKVDGNVGGRTGNFAALYKGVPISCGPPTVVNTVEVPHFDLKEDPSFWMDHNVQVLIRVRPLNSMERSTNGYNRCLKQESAQSITWIGQPETRFTFDHVACETVDQEMLFRMAGLPMVENCLSGYNSCMFAYGQTGSGKTYTMLGEIENLEAMPSLHRGMTPRIFEFLFARIQAEEESRRDEKLKYNCKCSFLEIYNEQITDLLDPSSTNLLLREDVKKGVYVENLSEFEVQTVSDILSLLTQKTSGAEGERLKEAANINKSLSTLGHVIMVLMDVAHGKPRHIPYRDSRLTFLLQDSLGGNSKTMIIANVSPSICCAAETLNTLKFAQRAKMIQNNAVVNEDSTGDVTALQHQIRLLKVEELYILKRQNVSRSLSFGLMTGEDMEQAQENGLTENLCEMDARQDDNSLRHESKGTVRMSIKQLKSLETTLAGALRREQMAETSIKQLEAEIEQLNRLVSQREEDTRCTKMMLRFREDKIQRMESVLNGSISSETYLLEENRELSEEIRLLLVKLDRNPEVTRFAMENIRLLDQLRRYQEFYGEGEREILLSEVSTMRDQLHQFLDGNAKRQNNPNFNLEPQSEKTLMELEECRRNLNSCLQENAKLSRELDDLRSMLNNLKSATSDQEDSIKKVEDSMEDQPFDVQVVNAVQTEEIGRINEPTMIKNKITEENLNLQLELDILKIILKEERTSSGNMEERIMCLNKDLELATGELLLINKQYEDTKKELEAAKSVIEAIESQQILSINEMEDLRSSNIHYVQRLQKQEVEIMSLKEQLSLKELRDLSSSNCSENDISLLQSKVKRMQHSLEKAKRLNTRYQSDHEFQVSNDEEMAEVCRQAEAETAEVIVCMQEELAILQQEVQDSHLKELQMNKNVMVMETELKEVKEKVYLLTKDNESLFEKLEEKDRELKFLSEEWGLLTSEIEEVLTDGCEILDNTSDQLSFITSSFPQNRIWISEHVGRMVRTISEKELLIEELRRCLEDANNKRSDVEVMLQSLRGAAVAITEAHQQECSEKEKYILHLTSKLSAKTSTISKLENRVKLLEDQIRKTSDCATVAYIIVNRLSEVNRSNLEALKQKNIDLCESAEINLRKDAVVNEKATVAEEAENEIQSLRAELSELGGLCDDLRQKLSKEQEHACALKQKLEDVDQENILMAKDKLTELKVGVSNLRTCMSTYVEHYSSPEKNNSEEFSTSFDGEKEGRIAIETYQNNNVDKKLVEDSRTNFSTCSLKLGKGASDYSSDQEIVKSRRSCENGHDRDFMVVLLKKEIESALESLKEVQAEMGKLHEEKTEMQMSEQQNQQIMKCFITQALNLEATMNDFENQFKLKMEAFSQRLESFEHIVLEAGSHWYQTKQLLELEVDDAKLAAGQKTAEVTCILSKFEEAQDTMKEADIMINGLIIANETMKLELGNLQKMYAMSISDKNRLMNEVQSLQSINDVTNQQFEHLGSDLIETNALVVELEDMIAEIQTTSKESFMFLSSDFHSLKSQIFDSSKLVRSWLEDIWSEIIVKDCALSVLHLCHMGILLETVMGLNAENGLLQHGLCESNSVIADLRQHNTKSRRELEMCRVIKGKLLADIKSSFDRISRKEEENQELSFKLTTFEEKISDLQLQEELMLQRSDYMGSQLAILMKELDLSNTDLVQSLLDQEKFLEIKEKVLESQAEGFMFTCFLKDFESLILASELEEMASRKADLEGDLMSSCAVLEKLQKEIILFKVDAGLKEQFLTDKEDEVGCLISVLDQKNQNLQEDNHKLQTLLCELQNELGMKKAELSTRINLEKENNSLRIEISKLKTENNLVLQHLDAKDSDFQSSLSHIDVFEKENCRLKDEILSVETCLASLQMDLKLKNAEMHKLQQSQATTMERLYSKSQDLETYVNRIDTLIDGTLLDLLNEEGCKIVDNLLHEICEIEERTSKLMEELQCVECYSKGLISENSSLQTELLRKDEVLKGLLFDLSLLQESASKTKDQKDEIAEMMASLESLEDELSVKTGELHEAVASRQMLEAKLLDKTNMICALELTISKEREFHELLVTENLKLRGQIEDSLAAKSYVEEELMESKKINENLEMELVEMSNALGLMTDSIETLRCDLNELASERDDLQTEMLSLKEKLEREEGRAEENKAIAKEAQQLAESRKVYAEDKEVEVKLLERSVEELECTVNVLENKVDIIKGEAERQRLQREELELELQAVKHQMQNVLNADADMKRHLDEKEKNLQEAQNHIQILERDTAEKDAEIAQFKTHISELNLHAEAQASEYKQKFKALEAMAEQVRPEGHSNLVMISSSNKSEKYATKSRGSGSPFKCIGLGLAQQIKSERDEENTAARLRIEELESLSVSRQKEIFALNARLAAAESMTHDVIRDLLGVKLDMTTYVSLLDNQQVQKITEKARLHSLESQEKEHEVINLKKRLNEFIEEREAWLEEINRKQAEVVAIQIALEKHQQHDQLLKTENEMLKAENANHKKKVIELEGEVYKLSGQQNLQQRIHHHAKIKEENNMLKMQNEDLSTKLRRTEHILSRVKEELSCFRASNGRNPYINFDEEKRLNTKLKESEEEKVQLAQKLLALCTSVLKAAGVTKPVSNVNPYVAEEALEQIKNKITSMEREIHDLKFKNRIVSERIRLSELMPQSSPSMSSRSDEKCQTPKRVSQAPYFSALDR